MINTTSKSLKSKNSLYISAFKFILTAEFSCSVDLSMKKVV